MITEAVRSEIVETARRIADRKVGPYEGAAYIWRIMAEVDYVDLDEFRVWVGFASEWQDSPEYREVIEQDIVRAARSVLDRHGRSHK